MRPGNETVAAARPEAGFAGREASRNGLRSPGRKARARGGTMGTPTPKAAWGGRVAYVRDPVLLEG